MEEIALASADVCCGQALSLLSRNSAVSFRVGKCRLKVRPDKRLHRKGSFAGGYDVVGKPPNVTLSGLINGDVPLRCWLNRVRGLTKH